MMILLVLAFILIKIVEGYPLWRTENFSKSFSFFGQFLCCTQLTVERDRVLQGDRLPWAPDFAQMDLIRIFLGTLVRLGDEEVA